MLRRHLTPRRSRIIIGFALLVGLLIQFRRAGIDRSEQNDSIVIHNPVKVTGGTAIAAIVSPPSGRHEETLADRAARDPVGFLEFCIDQYDRSVRDYTCTFTKQELIGEKLSAEQVMRAFFREKPFSVRLEWTKNEDKCSRVLYVADRWVEKGKQMAVVEPGAIARLFIPYVMRQIDGPEARKSSRRTINQFGVRNSLSLILKYCQIAKEKGILDFEYLGKGDVDGRETLVFERRLPYTGEDGPWPDRVLLVHIDEQWLLPSLCLAYSDPEKQNLLGKYMTTDLKLNANLSESVFTKQGMGL